MIVDLFAGPGGWSEGLRILGAADVGVEMDYDACRTRIAAGHETIRADVQRLPLRLGPLDGLIASPPCTDFSMAGKKTGRTGATGQLIDTVPPLVERWMPRWVACEQVPPCLPIWHEHAAHYRTLGYRTWVGVLNAANYGVPQTRKRAFLLASLDVQPRQPVPTHAKTPGMFTEQWVSMADALGWEPTTVNTRGNRTTPGGNEFDSNLASWTLTEKARSWVVDRRTYSRGPAGTVVPVVGVSVDRPAPTLVQAEKWIVQRPDERYGDRAGTNAVRITVRDALILQSFPADYPVQGSRSSQFRQVGNAVPPLLAARVLEQFVR